MSKSISTALLTGIQSDVTTLAICLELVRSDGRAYYMTNHDTNLVVNGNTYDHLVPFSLSAITSGSQLAADAVTLTLIADETTFLLADFKSGAFTHADVTVSVVDFENPSNGALVLRKGRTGPETIQQKGVIEITVLGLLSVLDLTVGRIYSPTCDADFGDARCKVAVNQTQVRSYRNPVKNGEWAYYFDPALMTAISLTNAGFESNVGFVEGDPITGWTQSTNGRFTNALAASPAEGSQYLAGGTASVGAVNPEEMYVYRDITLATAGISTSDIDAGKITLAFFASMIQTGDATDTPRMRYELRNASGIVIDSQDTGYVTLDTTGAWRDRALVAPILSGARSVRLYLYMRRAGGTTCDCGIDDVKLYWWDHIAGSPNSGLIYKAQRIVSMSDASKRYPVNASFEVDGVLANSNTNNISGWTKEADGYFSVDTYLGIVHAPDGLYQLKGGSGGSASVYRISQRMTLTTLGLDTDSIDLSHYIGRFDLSVLYDDTTSGAGVRLEWEDAGHSVIQTDQILPDTVNGVAGTVAVAGNFQIPPLARYVTIKLRALPPSGSPGTLAKVAFDGLGMYLVDASQAFDSDASVATGSAGTVFNANVGDYTFDGGIVWVAYSAHLYYDRVATVTDRKTFNGTSISGGSTAWVLAPILWVSGQNAGRTNVVRVWTSGTKLVKLYFPCAHPITVGDRYRYIRPCHKRFFEDCVTVYENGINFRGFPHVPGKL